MAAPGSLTRHHPPPGHVVNRALPCAADLQALGICPRPRRPKGTRDFRNLCVPKPWGEEYLLFQNEDVALWILRLNPGASTSMHCHARKNTSLTVLGGEARCRTLDGELDLAPLYGIYLGKKRFHQTVNTGRTSLWVAEIESPVDKFDLVRMEDAYGRAGTGYETGTSAAAATTHIGLGDLARGPALRTIGESVLEIGRYASQQELAGRLGTTREAVVTLLDRHIWTSDRQKFMEVGHAFGSAQCRILNDYRINRVFHSLFIYRRSA